MRWLFIHRDLPGQFRHVMLHLAALGHDVVGIGRDPHLRLPGVQIWSYSPNRGGSKAHPFVQEFDLAVHNGMAVADICQRLKDGGYCPHIAVGHNGWGEIFFVKDVWPGTPLLGYFEFFYRPSGSDADFDPEFPAEPDQPKQLKIRNAVNLVGLDAADWGITPTRWQRDQYPGRYWNRLSVAHEGIDTDIVRPDSGARLILPGIGAAAGAPLITFSARSLEPYRGFHQVMRAVPRILRDLPEARVLMVGGDGVSYGNPPVGGGTWRQRMRQELDGRIDWSRVHFLGNLPYRDYLNVLQVSAAHVYLTYPFILSWGLLEAMAAGCALIASRTPPVEEVVVDGVNGHLVDFFDPEALAERVVRTVRAGDGRIRANARETIQRRFDLKRVCLPAQLALLNNLALREVAA